MLENSSDNMEGAVEDLSEEIAGIRVKAKHSAKKLEMAMAERKLSLEDTKDKRRSLVAIVTSIIALLTTIVMSIFGISGS